MSEVREIVEFRIPGYFELLFQLFPQKGGSKPYFSRFCSNFLRRHFQKLNNAQE